VEETSINKTGCGAASSSSGSVHTCIVYGFVSNDTDVLNIYIYIYEYMCLYHVSKKILTLYCVSIKKREPDVRTEVVLKESAGRCSTVHVGGLGHDAGDGVI
jgi:hypothetical protein